MVPVWLQCALGVFLAVWLALSGGLLCVRALLHATQPMRSGQLILTALGLMATASLSRMLLGFGRRAWPEAAASLGLLLWGLALSRLGTSGTAVGLYWLLFLCEETYAWGRRFYPFRRSHDSVANRPGESPEGLVVQQFTRALAADGADVIQGSLMVQIAGGARMGVAHIAFCPPFVERPQCDVHFTEPQNATLKVSQLYAHGARLEVRLPQAAQADIALAVHFGVRLGYRPRSAGSQ